MALDLIVEFEGLIDALEREGIDYAVCGGLALGILGKPRATKDIDVLVRRDDIERAKDVARARGFDIPARKMVFRAGKPDENEMHRLSKIDPETSYLMPVDFLVVVPIYEDVWASRLTVTHGTRTIRVVSHEGLVKMKTMSGRPQDLADIARLQDPDDGTY